MKKFEVYVNNSLIGTIDEGTYSQKQGKLVLKYQGVSFNTLNIYKSFSLIKGEELPPFNLELKGYGTYIFVGCSLDEERSTKKCNYFCIRYFEMGIIDATEEEEAEYEIEKAKELALLNKNEL